MRKDKTNTGIKYNARRELKETYVCGHCQKEFPVSNMKIRFCPYCGVEVNWKNKEEWHELTWFTE